MLSKHVKTSNNRRSLTFNDIAKRNYNIVCVYFPKDNLKHKINADKFVRDMLTRSRDFYH